VTPWTVLWDRNVLVTLAPWFGTIMASEFVRGGVTGVGIVTVAAGLRDLAGVFFARQSAGAAPQNPESRPS
jgi:hypothetical protein